MMDDERCDDLGLSGLSFAASITISISTCLFLREEMEDRI